MATTAQLHAEDQRLADELVARWTNTRTFTLRAYIEKQRVDVDDAATLAYLTYLEAAGRAAGKITGPAIIR